MLVQTGIAIKWAVVGAILLLLVLWLVLGRLHAQRRIRRGQRPLVYHRVCLHKLSQDYMLRPCSFWSPGKIGLVSIHSVSFLQTDPAGVVKVTQCKPILLQVRSRDSKCEDETDDVAYNTDHVPPPVYQPPDGGSKMDPHQDWAAIPPPGPPPGHEAGESSRTMETVPLRQDEAEQDHTSTQPHIQTENPGMMSRLNPFK